MSIWDGTRGTASFLEPCEIVGTLLSKQDLDPEKSVLEILLDTGAMLTVNAVQEQLRFKLILADPQPGDRIRIKYLGESTKALPGMAPTKLFQVAVRKQEPGDGTENGSGAGS